MPYGTIKVDTITFTAGGVDTSVSISGLVQNPTFSGNITTTGTISGVTVIGSTTVSGATVTGTTASFTAVTGGTAGFTTVTGTTVTGTTANFATLSGTTVTGGTVRATTVTGISGVFTAQVSGATVTGTTASFTSGVFANISGGTHTITSGVFASGTAAAPSITFNGDLDTGIYNSAANEVAISTAGSGRFFVDASGRVIIGNSSTTNVAAFNGALQLQGTNFDGAAAVLTNVASNTTGSYLLLGKARGATLGGYTSVNNGDNLGQIRFMGADGTGYVEAAYIGVTCNGVPGTNNMPGRLFFSTNSGTSSVTERMCITPAGLVGIGTSSVSSRLHVLNVSGGAGTSEVSTIERDNSGYFFRLIRNAGSGNGGGLIGADSVGTYFTGGLSTSNMLYLDSANSAAQIHTSGFARLTIDSSGRCGIGTTGPNAIFETSATATGNTVGALLSNRNQSGSADSVSLNFGLGRTVDALYFSCPAIQYVKEQQWTGTASTVDASLVFATTRDESTTEKARITSSGQLLVGTSSTSSTALLQVQGNSSSSTGGAIIQLRRGTNNVGIVNNTALGSIEFSNTESTISAVIAAEADANWNTTNDYPSRLVFSTTADGASSPTERMRISNDGDIGIGVTPNTERLRIKGATSNNSTQAIYIANSSDTDLFYINNDGALWTGGAAESPYNSTTATAANAVLSTLGGTGRLQRSTSSLRYKKNVETLEDSFADAILSIRPVWYQSACSGDNPEWGHWGFIAEEVAEIDPRLVHWKTHESLQDKNAKPISRKLDKPLADGVQYDRFVPHLLNLIKRQKEQIEAMEARLAALESA